MGEFELINHYFKQAACAQAQGALALGIGDDCALLNVAAGQQLAVSSDSVVAGVHFPENADPYLLAQRGLGCAVSDLAAMGAEPLAFTLALTLPCVEQAWLKGFAQGLNDASQTMGIALAGGDTTRGPLNLNFTVFGQVPVGQALRRSGAQVGDLVCVSNTLGNGAGALPFVLEQRPPSAYSAALLKHYWQPQAQQALGQCLRQYAHAAMDISDGLLADAAHIASASQVAIEIDLAQLPLSTELLAEYGVTQAQHYALTGGDDYELLFCLPGKAYRELCAHGFKMTVIGEVKLGCGVRVVDAAGAVVPMQNAGFSHF